MDAPVHSVFEYCLDPRRIYTGDPMNVADATLIPGGVGTTAHLTGKMFVFVEEVAIEYVEVVRDHRIVFQAYPTMTAAGLRHRISVATHTLTWTFTPEDGGTRLAVVVVEQNPPRWQRVLDRLTAKGFSKQARERLARIKASLEEESTTEI
jgi:uncharacterized protein YndB with AHSA1/START domain